MSAVRFAALALGATVLGLAAPIAWTEATCRGPERPQAPPLHVTAPDWTRPEARSFLTFPEWHIVYAYEDLARTLDAGDAHDYPYLAAIGGFWGSLCAVTRAADAHGRAGLDAKATIYTIGASFTLEMALKGAYEETAGRLAALLDTSLSPQDAVEAEMASVYGSFLHQVPWYRFDFDGWTARLWEAPVASPRGWERRLALGAEWKAKAAYARAIGWAAGEMGADAPTMRVAVRGLGEDAARTLPSGQIVERPESGLLILEVPRYRIFTRTAAAIAAAGGTFVEIAGNDDILVSILGSAGSDLAAILPEGAGLLRHVRRPGFPEDRFLVGLTVPTLATLIRRLDGQADLRLEHIYDY